MVMFEVFRIKVDPECISEHRRIDIKTPNFFSSGSFIASWLPVSTIILVPSFTFIVGEEVFDCFNKSKLVLVPTVSSFLKVKYVELEEIVENDIYPIILTPVFFSNMKSIG